MHVADHDTISHLCVQMTHLQAIISLTGCFIIRLAVETFAELLEDKSYHQLHY